MKKNKALSAIMGCALAALSGCVCTSKQSVSTSKPKVKLGIENISKYDFIFKGKKLGLLTNPTGTNSKLENSIDVLKKKYNLVALYSPEHGIRGNAQAGDDVSSNIDEKSGLEVFSLYTNHGCIAPTEDMLKDIDILCYDVQDIGARFYTYISTMGQAMQACKTYNKTFVVFDRPNPISGDIVEGGILQSKFKSNVGMYQIPIRYGLTCGEIARYINKQDNINCKLYVIPMEGWNRNMFWSDTNLPWVQPSPNIPTPTSAIVYAGTCLFEGTNVSEGRGTTKPFELIGAPWIKSLDLSDKLNSLNLPGVIFSPAYFTPTFSKFKGEMCGGVCLHVRDKHTFRAVETAVAMIDTIKSMYKDKFEWRKPVNNKWWIDLLTGSTQLRESDLPYQKLISEWNKEASAFKEISKKFYLYK